MNARAGETTRMIRRLWKEPSIMPGSISTPAEAPPTTQVYGVHDSTGEHESVNPIALNLTRGDIGALSSPREALWGRNQDQAGSEILFCCHSRSWLTVNLKCHPHPFARRRFGHAHLVRSPSFGLHSFRRYSLFHSLAGNPMGTETLPARNNSHHPRTRSDGLFSLPVGSSARVRSNQPRPSGKARRRGITGTSTGCRGSAAKCDGW